MALTILKAREREPTFASKFVDALAGGASDIGESLIKKNAENLKKGEREKELEIENKVLEEQGYKVKGIKSPEIRKQIIANTSAEQREERKIKEKKETDLAKIEKEAREKIAPYKGALETINEMRGIGKGKNLGFFSHARGLISKQTRKDRAKYTQLGKSLIQFASTIPIRNKSEFETLAHDLYNPDLTDASREGILDAMQKIVENSLKSLSPQGQDATGQQNIQQQERPPLQSFMR